MIQSAGRMERATGKGMGNRSGEVREIVGSGGCLFPPHKVRNSMAMGSEVCRVGSSMEQRRALMKEVCV